jgi:DNA-binding NtrC family response regulator
LFATDKITVADLPDDYQNIDHIDRLVKACHSCFNKGGMPFQTVMNCLETRLLNEALESSDGNQSEAARKLGMKLSTFRDKLKKAESCDS